MSFSPEDFDLWGGHLPSTGHGYGNSFDDGDGDGDGWGSYFAPNHGFGGRDGFGHDRLGYPHGDSFGWPCY